MVAEFDHTSYGVYVRTKTRMPALSGEIIDRPRLWKLLDAAVDAKVVLFQAPGGYGKTSLLQQWGLRLRDRGVAVAWFTADPTDDEAEAFLRYLIYSLGEAGIESGDEVRSLIAGEAEYSWELIATALANSFVGALQPCYLILDDVQYLRDSPAMRCLRHLLDAAPAELHFVLATREDTGIPLGRLRATGQCIEVLAETLRFDSAEIGAYLTRCGHEASTPDRIATLEARTEGWIAGLKLLGMALRWKLQGTTNGPVISGEQRELADFFAEDVLESQSPEVQEFLLRTSVLDRLSPELCDSLPGVQNSRALLDECSSSGLFVIALDGTRTWYRYHQMFAEFLRRKLRDREPRVARELYVAASSWSEAAGFFTEAFEYALRGNDSMRAAEILDVQCERMWAQGRQQTIQSLAARLPAHIQARYPRIMLAIAWRLTAQWRVDEAHQLVAASRARVAEMLDNGTDAETARNLNVRVLHRESQISHYLYDPERGEQLCRRALCEIDESEDPYLAASLMLTLQYGLRERFRLNEVPRYIERARELMERHEFSQVRVFHSALAGPSYLLLGRTAEAIDTLSLGLNIATKLTGTGSELGGIAASQLAYVFYECNRLTEANDLLQAYSHRPSIGLADQLAALCITRARLKRAEGDSAAALEILEEASTFADAHELNYLRGACIGERVRILLRTSQPDLAKQVARHGNLAGSLERSLPGQRRSTLDSMMAQSWCRLAALTGHTHKAITVARQWRSHVTAARAAHAAAQWNIVLAELLLLAGNRNAAQRALANALSQAEHGGLVRMFVDAGEPIVQLLEQAATREQASSRQPSAFIATVAAACGCASERIVEEHSTPVGLAGPVTGSLSTRELEILQRAGAGMANKRISRQLGLTEGTVKWYLQQVYNKLGVRGRTVAAAKARQLGIID
jgi:LuxR family maltose regulon positive regulatory protein